MQSLECVSPYYSLAELHKKYPAIFRKEIYHSFEIWTKELESAKECEDIVLSLFKICMEDKKGQVEEAVSRNVYYWINQKIETGLFFSSRPVEISKIACANLSLAKAKIPSAIKRFSFPSESSKEVVAADVVIFPLVAHSPIFHMLLPTSDNKLELIWMRRDLLLEIIHILNKGKKIDVTKYFGLKNSRAVIEILEKLQIPISLIEEKSSEVAVPERCEIIDNLIKKLQRVKDASDARSVVTIEPIIVEALKNIEIKKDWNSLADWIDIATCHSAAFVIDNCLNIFLARFDELYRYFKGALRLDVFSRLLKKLSPFVTEIKETIWTQVTEEQIEFFATLFGKNLRTISFSSRSRLSIDEVIRRLPETVLKFSFHEAEKFTNAHVKLLSQCCPYLISLELESSSITDLTNLQFKHLERLVLQRARHLKNIEGLPKLPLSEVLISGSRVANFRPLVCLSTTLVKLSLQDSLIVDISFTKTLSNLKELDVSGSEGVLNLIEVPKGLEVFNIEKVAAPGKDLKNLEAIMKRLSIKKIV